MKLKKFLEDARLNIMGIPFPLFLVCSVIVLVAVYTNQLPSTILGGLAVCFVFGYLLKFLFTYIPPIQKTIGMAAISFTCAILVYFHLIPDTTVTVVKQFITKSDFLGFFISALLCGSIMSTDRKTLLRTGSRYIVPILGCILCGYGAGILGAKLLGYDWKDTLLYIAGPIMGGGNGAGAVPMSKMYAAAIGGDADAMYSKLLPAITLGNWIAIFCGTGLKVLGDRFPSLTGHGVLMSGFDEEKEEHKPLPMAITDWSIGLFLSAAFCVFGILMNRIFPSIHEYAFTILAVAIVKIAGILPEKMESCIVNWYQFMSKNFIVVIMAGVGIGMFNLATLFEVLSLRFVLLCLIIVLAATLGAGLFGCLVKFFFVESGITAGLCMCNAGGNGDVMVLTAADRMELMSFAQISSRIGGAIILILQSILATLLLH